MRMRAAVMYEQGLPAPYAESRPLVIEEVDLEGPGEGELLVEIAAAGLCHSDLSAIAGKRPRTLPAVVGHECAGIVRELGPGVSGVSVDDHVVMVFVASCGHCPYCYDARPNLCESSWASRTNGTLSTGGRRLSVRGKSLNHYSGISAFAEYAVVSQSSVVRIDKAFSLKDAAVFGCAVVTGVGAVVNTANLKMGQSAAVVGLGGVGLSAILGARAAGAGRIIAIDTNPDKLALALELGATDVFNAAAPDVVAEIKALTGGGVNHVFEMAGVQPAIELSYEILRRGGQLTVASLPDASARFALPLANMVGDERAIVGSYMGSCSPQRDIPRFLELYRQGRLPVDRLRSAEHPLESINEGFDRLARGEAVRDLVVFR